LSQCLSLPNVVDETYYKTVVFIRKSIGVLAILAVLVHGYMLSRKKRISAKDDNEIDDLPLEIAVEDSTDHLFDSEPNVNHIDVDESNEPFDFSTSANTEDEQSINFVHDDENLEQQFIVEHEEFDELNEVVGEEKPVSDVFIFNVVAREGTTVRGHELLQFFLTAGFRFGEMSIFHRHENSDGTGPVLFSIANMMQPGTFDLDKMEQFSSQGVSFFLSAPNDNINIKKAFDMMLLAVEQMAEEFDCVVLNEQRTPLTEQEFRNYHKRLLRYCQ
jgi:cell division protein ZipA